jgi:hypothetical protein
MRQSNCGGSERAKVAAVWCGLAGVLAIAAGADAQWAATVLHPSATGDSRAHAAVGSEQFGWVRVGLPHATVWSSSSSSWIDINPIGGVTSSVFGAAPGVSGGSGQQAGFYRTSSSAQRACIWSGTAASHVNLHPAGAGAGASECNATDGVQQVGYATVSSGSRASLWTGTAASWINLNPAGATLSNAYAVQGGVQGGIARVNNLTRASIWTGTAASWIDLSPPGSTLSSVNAIDGNQQGGYAIIGNQHAVLWTGTVASMIDLHPPSANGPTSGINAMKGGMQVGFATNDGTSRASVWIGTPESWINLHDVLPPGVFGNSVATAIEIVGDVAYVTGYARRSINNMDEAVLWTGPVDTPVICNDIDVNNDGASFDPQDIDAFFSVFSEGPCIPASAGCDGIDFNNDGSLFDPCDIAAFLTVFAEGPCTACGG